MDIELFIKENSPYEETILKKYDMLNSISFPYAAKKFPYNVLSIVVEPTYNTFATQVIKRRNFYGGSQNVVDIFVFY